MKNTVVLSKPYVKIAKSISLPQLNPNLFFLYFSKYRPVCATCVMFDLHLKHDIVPFDEGGKYLRDSIKENSDKGLLKKEFAETRLLEIREYGLRLEKLRNDTIKLIEKSFNSIISVVKKRKTVLMSEIIDYFGEEKEKVNADEKKWIENQKIAEKIVALAKVSDDGKILKNAKFICDSLKELEEKPTFRETKLLNVVDSSLHLDEEVILSYEEILHYLSQYMEILEPNLLEFNS